MYILFILLNYSKKPLKIKKITISMKKYLFERLNLFMPKISYKKNVRKELTSRSNKGI